MKCRNFSRDDVKTKDLSLFLGEVWKGTAICPGGVRHKGGGNLVQATMWNVGTCSLDAKEEIQVEDPQE
jgi:hypothetical protein